MSVLIKGMEKPEHCGYCRFRYDGICHALQKTQYSMDECPLAGIDDVPDICVGDTISRQAALNAMDTWDKFGCDPDGKLVRYDDDNHYVPYVHYDDMVHVIKHLPSAQAERKRGEWRHYEGYLTCSECGTEYDDDIMTHCCDDVPKYCPNCGARMEREDE